MTLTDRLFELEAGLDRNDGDTEDAFLGRRMAFRETLRAWGDDRYREGYSDGMQDVRSSQHRASERERDKADTTLSGLQANPGTNGGGVPNA